MDAKGSTPWVIKVFSIQLIVLGGFAGLGSLMLWGQGFLFAFPKDVPLASPMADFFINSPLSVLAGIGLWRMRQFGYVTAQIVAGFYIYASVLIFVDMFQGRLPSSPEIWGPQAYAVLMGLGLIFCLWPLRKQFV